MRRTALVAGIAALALGLTAGTASAVPPQHFTVDPPLNVVQDAKSYRTRRREAR